MATVAATATTGVAIPTDASGARSFRQRTSLDGHEYVLTFDWNERSSAWFFSLADTDETPLLSGKKITVGTDLLGALLGPARPPGQIICLEVSGLPVDPGLTSLGDTHELLYVT